MNLGKIADIVRKHAEEEMVSHLFIDIDDLTYTINIYEDRCLIPFIKKTRIVELSIVEQKDGITLKELIHIKRRAKHKISFYGYPKLHNILQKMTS